MISIISVVCMGWFSLAFAQASGSLAPVDGDQTALPAGATYEGGVVSHPITSTDENLHLLAGYYYNNPREWKRIYNDNRKIIRNPNRLPVGQTLKIHVGEGWKPRFSYAQWLQTANRNGQWKSGQPWRRARGPQVFAPTASVEKTAAETPVAAPQPEQPTQAEPTPADTPQPEQPAVQATPADTPTPEQPAVQATPADTPAPQETPTEKSSNKEVAPQF